jgi:glycosyltransferase involved in cell wall biosynthesis
MNILLISTDATIMEKGSRARSRMEDYLGFCRHLHIIILNAPGSIEHVGTLSLYPVRSFLRHLAPLSALDIGKRIMKEVAIDVISTQDPFETGIVGMRLAAHTKVPLHVQVHTDIASPYFKDAHRLNRARLLLASQVLPTAQAIRAVSERVKQGLMRMYPGIVEPSVLPIVSEARIYRAEHMYRFPFTVLIMARLEKEKNILYALRALAPLMKKYPGIGVLVVGEGRERSSLEHEAHALGVKERVAFMGWRSDIDTIFAQSHVFFGTSSYEGYGLTLIEAAEAGVPIISTDVGIVGEVLKPEESVLLCPLEDVECVARMITRLINDEGLRHFLSMNAKNAVAAHRARYKEYPRLFVEDVMRAKKV